MTSDAEVRGISQALGGAEDDARPMSDDQMGETPPRLVSDDSARFLAALAPDGQLTFQTLCLNKSIKAQSPGKAARLNHELQGSFVRCRPQLKTLNESGACVFVMVCQGDGSKRSNASVAKVRAVFVDLDGSPLGPVLAAVKPPSITVETSPGRFHAYWLVRDMPLKDFKPAQQALAAMFEGDPAVCDPARLMRLPGFRHQKHGKGENAKLLSCFPDRVYDWKQLADALDLPRSGGLPERIPEGQRNTTLFKLASASRRQGVSRDQRLRSLLRVNRDRCIPPLPEDEVEGIVERAYRGEQAGVLPVPLALLEDEKFIALGWGEKLLLLLSYQRLTGRHDPEFALPWLDFKRHFPRESTFGTFRKRIVEAGFLTVTRAATKPKGGKPAQAGAYKLVRTR